jgi:hypothetical protein
MPGAEAQAEARAGLVADLRLAAQLSGRNERKDVLF